MYCIKCGVELTDGQRKCPLCETEVFHPDFSEDESKRPFPKGNTPPAEYNKSGILFVITSLFIIAVSLVLACDLSVHRGIIWSGYVIGGLALIYVIAVLPLWFKRPNPVIFVPCSFAAALIYLFYICLATQGSWFLSFACPVVLVACVIATAVTALNRYLRRGHLYVLGGASIAISFASVMLEYLIRITFFDTVRFIWSLYPVLFFFLFGIMLIVVAICKPLRRGLEKFFYL